MPTENPAGLLLDTLRQHTLNAGTNAEWAPPVAFALLALVGIAFVFKGARLMPAVAAIVLGGVGAALGGQLDSIQGLPPWLGAAAGAVVGILAGVLFFRLWLGLLVATCVTAVSLAAYTFQSLGPSLQNYLTPGLDTANGRITLAVEGPPPPPSLSGLWQHLSTDVTGFEINTFTILLGAAIAGLIFGLLLPRVARSFWAATFGSGFLLVGAYGLMRLRWPTAVAWYEQWALLVAAGVWTLSLVWNLFDMYGVRPRKPQSVAKVAPAA
ncbi:MAG: hypothetical protein AB1716_02190 [Planctomycetota bacterium]